LKAFLWNKVKLILLISQPLCDVYKFFTTEYIIISHNITALQKYERCYHYYYYYKHCTALKFYMTAFSLAIEALHA